VAYLRRYREVTPGAGYHRPVLDARTMHFLLPYARLELLIRTILTRQWDDEAWPLVKHEFVKAMKLRQMIRRSGWFN
jgi:hypothetical protein